VSEDRWTGPDDDALDAALEAVLFAAGEPVRAEEIASAFEMQDASRIGEALEALMRAYDERRGGLRLEQVAGGWRLATRHEVGSWVRKFFRQRNRTRLSPAGLETLAIIAYRQPITAPEIQAIRGVDPGAALKSLLDKKLVRILGRKKVVGNPLLYGTSRHFLVHFGLNNLEDLPSIEDFEEFLGALEGTGAPLFEAGGASSEEIEAFPQEPEAEPEDGEPVAIDEEVVDEEESREVDLARDVPES
jgi:segregation and condensation protein B